MHEKVIFAEAHMQQIQRKTKTALPGLTLRTALAFAGTLIVGLLVGRVRISYSVWPFGVAYIAAAFLNKEIMNPYAALAGVMCALCTNIYTAENIEFMFASCAVAAVFMIVITYAKLKRKYLYTAAAIFTVYVICTLCFKRLLILNVISSVVEMSIAVAAAFMLNVVIKLIFVRRRTVLNDVELISLGFTAVLAVLGVGRAAVAGVYLRDVCAVFIAACAAYTGGAAVGAATGTAVGAACMLGGSDSEMMLLLVVCSLVMGIFNNINRYIFVLSYILCALIVSYYSNYSMFAAVPFFTVLTACALMCAVPGRFYSFVEKYVSANVMRQAEQKLSCERFSELTVGRLNQISSVFKRASDVISSVEKDRQDEISYAISGIPESACVNCALYSGCWDRNFEKTYQLMQKLYAKYRKQEKLSERDLGQVFLRQCLHSDEVIKAAVSTFKDYDTNLRWEKKVAQSRGVLKEQLSGLSLAINELAKEVAADFEIRTDVEDALRRALDEEGINAGEVLCHVSRKSMYVTVVLKNTVPLKDYEKNLKRAVSKACQRKMSIEDEQTQHGTRRVTLCESKTIGLKTAVACAAKDGMKISGDAHLVRSVRDSKYMLLISDGMGSGERAAKESSRVVSLLEDFYGAGFDDETVIRSLNKLMILGGADDMFSTIDMCVIDLRTARARFTKIGAPHSYIIRADRVRRISSGALPMGILEEMTPAVTEVQLVPGDVILMYSDGVSDAETDNEDIYRAIVSAAQTQGTKDIANTVLSLAAEARGGRVDDMTVIAARIARG